MAALRSELATTPKPGLVDCHDSGAHRDMDFHLMQRGIDSLAPWFAAIAVAAWRGEPGAAIRALGVEAEAAMFRATGGVNTHKGALFCLGLTLAAACRLVAGGAMPSAAALQQAVAQEAAGFEQPEDTHGGVAIRRFGRGGALASAREGYARVYSSWVPFLRSLPGPDTDAARLLTLLRIMSELDDSNILYRVAPRWPTRSRRARWSFPGNWRRTMCARPCGCSTKSLRPAAFRPEGRPTCCRSHSSSTR